jgi:hypothetical protein
LQAEILGHYDGDSAGTRPEQGSPSTLTRVYAADHRLRRIIDD